MLSELYPQSMFLSKNKKKKQSSFFFPFIEIAASYADMFS